MLEPTDGVASSANEEASETSRLTVSSVPAIPVTTSPAALSCTTDPLLYSDGAPPTCAASHCSSSTVQTGGDVSSNASISHDHKSQNVCEDMGVAASETNVQMNPHLLGAVGLVNKDTKLHVDISGISTSLKKNYDTEGNIPQSANLVNDRIAMSKELKTKKLFMATGNTTLTDEQRCNGSEYSEIASLMCEAEESSHSTKPVTSLDKSNINASLETAVPSQSEQDPAPILDVPIVKNGNADKPSKLSLNTVNEVITNKDLGESDTINCSKMEMNKSLEDNSVISAENDLAPCNSHPWSEVTISMLNEPSNSENVLPDDDTAMSGADDTAAQTNESDLNFVNNDISAENNNIVDMNEKKIDTSSLLLKNSDEENLSMNYITNLSGDVSQYDNGDDDIAGNPPNEDGNLINSKKRTLESDDQETSPSSEIPHKKLKRPLPRCRMTRTYLCEYCNLTTQNPRDHLYHIRDTHGEPIHIYECDKCQYASKNFTKLMRHMAMVHKMNMKELDEHGSRKKLKPSKYKAPPSDNPDVQLLMAASKKNPKTALNKSPRSQEEMDAFVDEFGYEIDEEEMFLLTEGSTRREDQTLQCDQCEYACKSQKHLAKHEVTCHLKKTFYRCNKCNYVTHLKGRYTKHMKYHQLPIIKCEYCDFRTPYRWNLDRHAKNHLEEGEHKCHLCNFSAQIKQSLTVHVANHHLTPDQIKVKELRRTIGISDPQDYGSDEEEMELMKMERDEHPDAFQLADEQSFTVSNVDQEEGITTYQDDIDSSESIKKKPKIKLTFKKMKASKDAASSQEANERHNFDDDFIHPDDLVHRNGNVYIKNYKCDFCSFKAAFKNELIRHVKKMHDMNISNDINLQKSPKLIRSSSSGNASNASSDHYNDDEDDVSTLSSLHSLTEENDTSSKTNSTESKDKKKTDIGDDSVIKSSKSNVQNLVCQYCGHNSKCLSESVRHQKLHLSVKSSSAVNSLSTRCQFCRHRCKSTDDLVGHLKHCSEARKNQIIDKTGVRRPQFNIKLNEGESDTLEENDDSRESGALEVDTRSRSSSRQSSETELPTKNSMEVEKESGKSTTKPAEASEELIRLKLVSDKRSTPSDSKSHSYTKRVYRCPQCKFWSTTASRFHVHIVGHFNKKPYVCSECNYRSNWRWDITKHIKIRVSRDGTHTTADVVITDETGEKNYEKYEKYVTVIQLDENLSSRTEGGLPARKGRPKRSPDKEIKGQATSQSKSTATHKGTRSSPATNNPVSNQPMVQIPIDGSNKSFMKPPQILTIPNLTSTPHGIKVAYSSHNPESKVINPCVTSTPSSLSNSMNLVSMSSSFIGNLPSTPATTVPQTNGATTPGSPPFKTPNVNKHSNPPPLVAMRNLPLLSPVVSAAQTGGQYQIITPQVSVNRL